MSMSKKSKALLEAQVCIHWGSSFLVIFISLLHFWITSFLLFFLCDLVKTDIPSTDIKLVNEKKTSIVILRVGIWRPKLVGTDFEGWCVRTYTWCYWFYVHCQMLVWSGKTAQQTMPLTTPQRNNPLQAHPSPCPPAEALTLLLPDSTPMVKRKEKMNLWLLKGFWDIT